MKNKILFKNTLYYFSTLIVCVIFANYLNKKNIELVSTSVNNFILIKDYSSLKFSLAPIIGKNLKSILIYENDKIVFKIGDEESFFNLRYVTQSDFTNITIIAIYAPIYEFYAFILHLVIYFLIYLNTKTIEEKRQLEKSKFDLARKIAHDIRSPISTLNLISSKIEDPAIKELQTMVVEQINSIANNLLNESNSFSNRTDNSTTSLMNILKQIEQEFEFKKVSFKRTIQFNLDESNFDKFTISKEQSKILYSCINNFIQNSIEATTDDSVIEVIVKKSDVNGKSFEIVVKDNGKGIPDHILSKLGTEAISYGKEANNSFNSGNGIVLFNAKKDLNQIGADLKIKSQINIGTEVTICI